MKKLDYYMAIPFIFLMAATEKMIWYLFTKFFFRKIKR